MSLMGKNTRFSLSLSLSLLRRENRILEYINKVSTYTHNGSVGLFSFQLPCSTCKSLYFLFVLTCLSLPLLFLLLFRLSFSLFPCLFLCFSSLHLTHAAVQHKLTNFAFAKTRQKTGEGKTEPLTELNLFRR